MNTPTDISELLQDDVQPIIVQVVTPENLDKCIEEEPHNEQSH